MRDTGKRGGLGPSSGARSVPFSTQARIQRFKKGLRKNESLSTSEEEGSGRTKDVRRLDISIFQMAVASRPRAPLYVSPLGHVCVFLTTYWVFIV